ncbi:hypothetical protein Moror_5283 [Moniliophthora roreri MCA 2997]|uniref:Uncharacterized protein n=2 Tax=Moniliophthora roreri TaxID=221103 RepID=V2X9J3_MONRO|nr:hypothetical protein Moror_5283 [Moniliophthora roreri MCA 2997]KAI3608996.1 hypothetical protein WG66_011026 [Moniliophthora roreri]
MPSQQGKTRKRFLEHSETLTLAAAIVNSTQEKLNTKLDKSTLKSQGPSNSKPTERPNHHRRSAAKSKLVEVKVKLAHERAQRKKEKINVKRRYAKSKGDVEQLEPVAELHSPKKRVSFA